MVMLILVQQLLVESFGCEQVPLAFQQETLQQAHARRVGELGSEASSADLYSGSKG